MKLDQNLPENKAKGRGNQIEAMRVALIAYLEAIEALGQQSLCGQLYFEADATKDRECAKRWLALNRAGVLAKDALCNANYSHTESPNELEKTKAQLLSIQREEIRRIRHLNRLATWAQQDPTGPVVSGQIQEWVLNEIKAALGAAYDPTAWQPEVLHPLTTPNAKLPPIGNPPRRKMLIEIEVSADFEKRLDNQWMVEREINADRWAWRWADELPEHTIIEGLRAQIKSMRPSQLI